MTALADVVDWTPPERGYWLRTFRLGEWLSDPMTPLFREWLLVLLEEGLLNGLSRLAPGATAPAWTPLFARAAAVVTDAGTLAAHASLVAREYGIPTVVGAGDATRRLRNGQLVTVDGGTGTVQIVGD